MLAFYQQGLVVKPMEGGGEGEEEEGRGKIEEWRVEGCLKAAY